ncbi:MAG: MFS transporter [Chloroflexi bacterium]|nr:MFS transporter [Chloroflexota bacterium]
MRISRDVTVEGHARTAPRVASRSARVPARPSVVVTAVGVALVALAMRQAVTGVPPILGDFGLSLGGQSLLVAIPVLCFSLGALAAPAARARLGEERIVFAVVALQLLGLAARAIWPGWALFPGTILVGLSIAVLNVLMPGLVKHRFPTRLGPMMAVYTTAITLGASLAAGLTVPMFQVANGSVTAALGIWAIPVACALIAWLPQIWPGAALTRSSTNTHRSSVWRAPLAWHVMLFMGIQSLLYYGALSWLPEIYRDRGVDPVMAGFLLMAFNGLGIVGNLIAPIVAVRLPDQRPAIAAVVALTAIGLLGILLAPTTTALFWACVLGIAQGASLSLALLLIVLRSADADTAARLSGMAQSGGYLIAAVGPLAMGLLHTATGGWFGPLLFLVAAAVVLWLPGMRAGRNVTIGAPVAASHS